MMAATFVSVPRPHPFTTTEETNMNDTRRPKPANANTPLAAAVPYTGTQTEVVDELRAGMVPSSRLLDVARWHDAKKPGRHRTIAVRLRAVAEQQDAGDGRDAA
jgi:hypothetical protein